MAVTGEGFKWFGEGFDGFPKVLPEDCVEYCIYIIDNTLKDFDVREKLRAVQRAANTLTRELLEDFIWQRESFALELQKDAERSLLQGRTNFGDSTDDEWTIVYILRELSKQFSDIWIRVFDTDGEFLLIEAANALPIWLNPEIGEYRVWIHDGQLLIVPLESPGGRRKTQDLQDKLSLSAAISWISDPSKSLQRSLKIETEAFARLQRYPEQVQNSLHHAVVTVPRGLAYVLHELPRSVSAATETFYLRDPIALKHLRGRGSAEMIFTPGDLVKTSVKFTKVGFAQLKSQQFDAPNSWKDALRASKAATDRPLLDMGMKLSCGFEMLLSDAQNCDKKIVREINLLLDDIKSGEASLPSDANIEAWGMRDDDDQWLDINFEDFERELSGKEQVRPEKAGNSGFGDQSAHANLQRTVKRFEDLLAQEAESGSMELMDDMDYDDDSADDDSSDTEDGLTNDRDNSIEDDFTAMMQDMMGMPPDVMNEIMKMPASDQQSAQLASHIASRSKVEESSAESKQGSIAKAMQDVGEELRDAGVFDT